MSVKTILTILACVCCLALVSCSTVKAPAEVAIKAADEAIAAVKSEASVYVPDQLKGVQDALATEKENFQKGEYQQALTGAKDLAAKAKDLTAAVAAKKDELTKTWQSMSGGLPGMVKSIQSRVAVLSKSKSLPTGLDKSQFENVKASLSSVTQTWTEASNAFSGGDLMVAVEKAKTVKGQAVEIMSTLKMKVPEASAK